MKRIFSLPMLLVSLLVLPACTGISIVNVEPSTLICDGCGKTFVGDADYSKELARDEEIMSALGIDLYSFYCPDCRNEYAASAIAYHFVSEDDLARLEAYDAGAEMTDENITILMSTNLDQYYITKDNLTGLYGIYDISEKKWVADPEFSLIDTYNSEGIALAQKDGFYGFINQMGNTIVSFQFVEADPFVNGLARVYMNKWGVIDSTGTFIVEPMYEEISILDNNYISICDGNLYGLCDSSGAIIIEINYLENFKFTSSRIYACKRVDSYGSWYEIFDYEGNSLMNTIPAENTLYVSYPNNGVHIVCFNYPKMDENFYYAYDENFHAIFGEACGYISDFSSFGYAVVIPVPSATRTWTGWEREEEGQFVIDKEGNRICQLPNIPSWDTRYSKGGGEVLYTYSYYVNQYYAIAVTHGGGGYLINLQSLEYSDWKSIVPFEDSNCVAVKDKNTELWSLYDGTTLVDSNCTNIKYSGAGMELHFKLYHGNEYIEYPF